MKTSGFTYIRNGLSYGYPFIPSIKSLLPLVDELVVVVGDSIDGTRAEIENLNNPKIKIIDTIWDDELRANGKIFALQSNIGLDNISGDWAIHLQADEVIHEASQQKFLDAIHKADGLKNIEGLLLPFYHFWGDYHHIRNTRRTHKHEIRAFKTNQFVRSYKDSQGFRNYPSQESYDAGEKGSKLKVMEIDVPVFHYSYTRNPKLMKKKSNYFHRFWHNDTWLKEHTAEVDFDFNEVDRLEVFNGSHPIVMQEFIKQKDWDFEYDPTKSNMRVKDKFLNAFERRFGFRPFGYKNYRR